MVVIYAYESDCPSNDSDQDELGSQPIRKVYHMTYNQRISKLFQRERISQKQFSSLFLVVLVIVLLATMPPNVGQTLGYVCKVQQKTNVGCVQKKFWLTSKAYLSGPFLKPRRQCLHFFGSI